MRSAQRTTSSRRSGLSGTPIGNWCAAVSSTASTSPSAVDHRAAGVDGDGDRREARGTDDLAVRLVPDLLDGDPPRTGRRERAAGEPEELAEPAGDDGALHRRDDTAHPAEVVGQGRPEGR